MKFGCRKHKFNLAEAAALLGRVRVPPKVTPRMFLVGLNVELEHRDLTCGKGLATAKIAAAHFRERPDYYVRLRKYVE